MRIAVFGGSFDPVHRGHLAIADAVRLGLAPDRLLWVPARHAPHKLDRRAAAAAEDRAALVAIAIAGRPGEELCTLELEREGPSYTVDTLEALHAAHTDAELLLVLGADSQEHLPSWRNLPRVHELAQLVFVPREGWREVLPGVPGRMLAMPLAPASSTEIRDRLARGEDCRDGLPEGVAEEIRRRGLYVD